MVGETIRAAASSLSERGGIFSRKLGKFYLLGN